MDREIEGPPAPMTEKLPDGVERSVLEELAGEMQAEADRCKNELEPGGLPNHLARLEGTLGAYEQAADRIRDRLASLPSEPEGDTTAAYIYRVEIDGLENPKALYFGPEVSIDLECVADAWRKTGAHVTRYVPAQEPTGLSDEDRKRLRKIADVMARENPVRWRSDETFLRNLANQQQGGTDA